MSIIARSADYTTTNKILISLFLSMALLSGAAAQEEPGPGSSGYAQEFTLQGDSWNNIAVNVDSISLSEADGDCSFDYDPYSTGGVSGYAWTVNPEEGGWEALGTDEELSTTKGYSIWVPETCNLVLEGQQASEVSERDLLGDVPNREGHWNLITLPEGTSPSDVEGIIENTDGVSIGDWEGERYWTNTGGEWTHPYDSLDNDRPFYIWVDNDVTLNLETDSGESGPGPGGSPDSGDDSDDETTAETGDIYFWSTETGGEALVHNNHDDPGTHYDMYDGRIVGQFIAKGSGERTITVEGPNGQHSRTDSGVYVGISGESVDWGVDQQGVYEMDDGTENEYTVTVEDAGSGEVIGGPVDFTFTPNTGDSGGDTGGDDGSGDDGSSDPSGIQPDDLEFKVEPTQNWYDAANCGYESPTMRERRGGQTGGYECDSIDVTFRARAHTGESLDGYRLEADINNNGYDNDPNPFTTSNNECQGGTNTCRADITHTVDGDGGSLDGYSGWAEIQEVNSYGGASGSRVTEYNTVARIEFGGSDFGTDWTSDGVSGN